MPKPTWKGQGGIVESIGISFAGISQAPQRKLQEDAPMTEAIIVDAIRTARGKRNGALAGVHPVDLLARTLSGALERAGVEAKDVDDVIMGCVTQAGEQGVNIA